MITSTKIQNFIKSYEVLRLHSYNDGTGNYAIGWGHTWHPNNPASITVQEAESIFMNDINSCEKYLDHFLKVPLLQYEYDACISFIFNVGAEAFELSSILLYLNQENKIEACSYFSRYCHSGKMPLEGLLKRRLDEANIFLGRGAPHYD